MGTIPVEHRTALRAALDELVTGHHPELLTWVRDYGESGAQLVRQPDEMWQHPLTDWLELDDGGASAVLPLWTTDESPSDLSAECEVTCTGNATITDVHVL